MDVIRKWRPKDYFDFIKGAQHKQIDEYEYMAKSAMANAYAANAKRAKETKIFDAKKARKELEKGNEWKNSRQRMDKETFKQLTDSLKGFVPQFRKKGGN